MQPMDEPNYENEGKLLPKIQLAILIIISLFAIVALFKYN
jgi:hypothetical protein